MNINGIFVKCLSCANEFKLVGDKDKRICIICEKEWNSHARKIKKLLRVCDKCGQFFIETDHENKSICNNCIKK